MTDLSQQKKAVTGLRIVYPIWAIVGMYSLLYVPSKLIDRSDAVLTASNIMADDLLFRSGIVGSLITQLIGVVAMWFLYRLFFKFYKEATITTMALSFLGIPISLLSVAPLFGAVNTTSDPDQMMFLIDLSMYGTMVSTIFWGLWLIPLGYMVVKSPLFPKVLGWLLYLAGFGYFVAAFAYFMGVEGVIMEILDMLTMGEVIWMLWVLIMGARWSKLQENINP